MIWTSFVCLCLLQIIWTGDAELVKLDCPAEFENGTVTDLKCIVTKDQTEINDKCDVNPQNVNFKLTRAGASIPEVACVTSFGQDCDAQPAQGQCGCTVSGEDTRTFTFKYIGNKTSDEGAKMECSICVLKSGVVIPSATCENMKFAAAGSVKSSLVGVLVSVIISLLLRTGAPESL